MTGPQMKGCARCLLCLSGLMVSTNQGLEHIWGLSPADFVGVNARQIRKDFSCFGGFGAPGLGCNIEKLVRGFKRIFQPDMIRKAAFVGAGDQGSVLLAYPVRAETQTGHRGVKEA